MSNSRSFVATIRGLLSGIIVVLVVTTVDAGPSRKAKKAVEARLVGHTLTLTTALYVYASTGQADGTCLTTVHPTKGLYYSAYGQADRDPDVAAGKVQRVEDALRRAIHSSAASSRRREPDPSPWARLSKSKPGRVIRITRVQWTREVSSPGTNGPPLLLVFAEDDLGPPTGFRVAWPTEWSDDLSEADEIVALITTHIGQVD